MEMMQSRNANMTLNDLSDIGWSLFYCDYYFNLFLKFSSKTV